LQADGRWQQTRKACEQRANGAVARMFSCISQTRDIPVRDACNMWKTGVLPTMLYGAEVWSEGGWSEADSLQHRVGCRILNVSRHTRLRSVNVLASFIVNASVSIATTAVRSNFQIVSAIADTLQCSVMVRPRSITACVPRLDWMQFGIATTLCRKWEVRSNGVIKYLKLFTRARSGDGGLMYAAIPNSGPIAHSSKASASSHTLITQALVVEQRWHVSVVEPTNSTLSKADILCDCPLYHQERQQLCADIQANWSLSIDQTNSSHSMTSQFVMLTLCYANGSEPTVIYLKQSLPVDLADSTISFIGMFIVV